MREFFTEFFDLLSNCILIICLAFVSFLFIINIYHFNEIRYNQVMNVNENESYIEYKQILKRVDKKMKSVNINGAKYDSTAKTIYGYYNDCISSLGTGTFAKFEGKSSLNVWDVYKANDEVLKKYNKSCIFGIPYNITVIGSNFKLSGINDLFKTTEVKRQIIIDNADYLVKSGLGNSSYQFTTDATKSGINNKLANEAKLTINNYRMIALVLEDVSNWYVAEFGGNR